MVFWQPAYKIWSEASTHFRHWGLGGRSLFLPPSFPIPLSTFVYYYYYYYLPSPFNPARGPAGWVLRQSPATKRIWRKSFKALQDTEEKCIVSAACYRTTIGLFYDSTNHTINYVEENGVLYHVWLCRSYYWGSNTLMDTCRSNIGGGSVPLQHWCLWIWSILIQRCWKESSKCAVSLIVWVQDVLLWDVLEGWMISKQSQGGETLHMVSSTSDGTHYK